VTDKQEEHHPVSTPEDGRDEAPADVDAGAEAGTGGAAGAAVADVDASTEPNAGDAEGAVPADVDASAESNAGEAADAVPADVDASTDSNPRDTEGTAPAYGDTSTESNAGDGESAVPADVDASTETTAGDGESAVPADVDASTESNAGDAAGAAPAGVDASTETTAGNATGAAPTPEVAPGAPPGSEVPGGLDAPDRSDAPRSGRSESPAAAPAASVLDVRELDWDAVRAAVADPPSGERAERIIARMEERLAGRGQLGLAFEEYAAGPADQAIQVGEDWPLNEVWFIGDVHGDLLALEAALQHIDRRGGGPGARLVFLGDLFDDGVHGAQVVLRVFELLLDGPPRVTVLAGNHDEALAYEAGRFQSTVLPSDFTDWLNARADDPLVRRLGRLIIRFFDRAPRALFFPDGLLVAHGGVPHTDLHEELERSGNWNDPRVLQDFVWLRAHPRARKRIPNRTTRGSEFGRDDFSAFCAVATRLGRPVSRMVRGHDHVEERFAVYPAWTANPVLTINTLSHRLPREVFGGYERVPVLARWVRGELPEVRRLLVPPELVREVYPEPSNDAPAPREGA
jgi:hypothetical protein